MEQLENQFTDTIDDHQEKITDVHVNNLLFLKSILILIFVFLFLECHGDRGEF